MTVVLISILIFFLRIADVSIGTVRVIYTIRGNRLVSVTLGVIESGVWIFAISRAIAYVDNPLSMIAWALGFGTGTVVGITIEKWVASGWIVMRVISPNKPGELREDLHDRGFGVTALHGEGHSQHVQILFIVAPRRRGKELIQAVQALDPKAFITIDPVSQAIGGYVPVATPTTSVRK